MRVLSYVLNGRLGPRSPETFDYAIRAMEEGVDVVSSQGTGMDPGPFYLGSDHALELSGSEIAPILNAAKRTGTPFVYSMGGAAGADVHFRSYLRVVNKICREQDLSLKVALLSGEISKEYLKRKIREGTKIPRSLDTPRLVEYLTEEEVDRAKRIQAQIGPEPIADALSIEGVDGVFTGRALDVGIHMASLLKNGIGRSQAAHIAKLVECASQATEPTHPFEFVLVETSDDSFTVTPTHPGQRCTIQALAAHSMYERENPYIERNPGGVLDVSQAVYEQIDDRTVRCSGGIWTDEPYTVKLEGVARDGFRNLTICGIRDPHMIPAIDDIMARMEEWTRSLHPDDDFSVSYSVLGRDAVLGPSEPLRDTATPHEVGLMITVTADSQAFADRLGNALRVKVFTADFPGRTTTAGNYANPTQPTSIPLGEAYVYNVWHLLPLDDPAEPFRREIVEFPLADEELESLFQEG